MSYNLLQSHTAMFAGRVNNCFYAGRPAWKPNHPHIKKALEQIIGVDKGFLKKLERMHTTGMKDNLISEVIKMYAPELARSANNAVGGNGKAAGKGKNNNNNNNNNKGKGKGKGAGKGSATAC